MIILFNIQNITVRTTINYYYLYNILFYLLKHNIIVYTNTIHLPKNYHAYH
jgi:hypothetical protein